jgi:hypothetical protein
MKPRFRAVFQFRTAFSFKRVVDALWTALKIRG